LPLSSLRPGTFSPCLPSACTCTAAFYTCAFLPCGLCISQKFTARAPGRRCDIAGLLGSPRHSWEQGIWEHCLPSFFTASHLPSHMASPLCPHSFSSGVCTLAALCPSASLPLPTLCHLWLSLLYLASFYAAFVPAPIYFHAFGWRAPLRLLPFWRLFSCNTVRSPAARSLLRRRRRWSCHICSAVAHSAPGDRRRPSSGTPAVARLRLRARRDACLWAAPPGGDADGQMPSCYLYPLILRLCCVG